MPYIMADLSLCSIDPAMQDALGSLLGQKRPKNVKNQAGFLSHQSRSPVEGGWYLDTKFKKSDTSTGPMGKEIPS